MSSSNCNSAPTGSCHGIRSNMASEERGGVVRTIDVHLELSWRDAGALGLDAAGSLVFPNLFQKPRPHRVTLTGTRRGEGP